jgi:hypothetical protein
MKRPKRHNKSRQVKFAVSMSEKRTAGVAQVVDCLPSKCEALSSNPTTVKKYL